jgi:SSS family solute:Na+ symporter
MMLAAFLSTNDTYLHSWGSIFVQDVIMPFRKKSFTPKQHMWMLRGSIIGVAVFVFAYSMLFRQTEDILMYFAITGAVFVGGIGSAIIGGLYWKRGSTAAAWSATIVGSILAVSGIVVHQVWPTMHEGARFPIHSQYLSVIAMSTAIIVYILVSLFGKRTDFNMDKMLHRGKYAEKIEGQVAVSKPARGLKALITPEFSLGDKFIYISVIVWAVSWFSLCIWGTVYNKIFGISPDWWPKFWRFYIYLSFVIGIVTTIWLVIGGLVDLKAMLAKLSTVKRNHLDDGMVIDHHNAGEELENGNNLSE